MLEVADADILALQQLLGQTRALVEPALKQVTSKLREPLREIIEYHYGWDSDAACHGSRMRLPALTLLSARACGMGFEAAVPFAASYSLLGNYTVIHDDVIDRDAHRRGRESAWARYGTPAAIQAGSAMVFLAVELLGSSGAPPPIIAKATRVLGSVMHQECAGQALDVELEAQGSATLQECRVACRLKTEYLIGLGCALGALRAGAGKSRVDELFEAGCHVGAMWQHLDDIEDVWGDAATLQEPAMADLRARKKSAPIVAALSASRPEAVELNRLYHQHSALGERELHRVAELVQLCGGRTWAEAALQSRARELRKLLDGLDLPGEQEACFWAAPLLQVLR